MPRSSASRSWMTAGVLVLLGFVALGEPPCYGSVIRLRIVPQAELIERFLNVSVELLNEGDEPAFMLQATVEAEGRSVTVPMLNRLGVGDGAKMAIHLPVGEPGPGSYSAVVRIQYTDANGYAFSTVAVTPFSKWEQTLSPVTATIQSADLASSAGVRVRVRNVDRRPHEVRLRLVAPRELAVSPAAARLSLPAGARQAVTFDLSSESALPGSAYVVAAIVDSEDQGRHTSTTVSTSVRILAPAWSRYRTLAAVGGLAVLPLLVVAVLRLRRRLRRAAKLRPPGRPALQRSPV